jgi:hypothetical protein
MRTTKEETGLADTPNGDALARLGGWRDGLLVAAGAIYTIGYGVWSFVAWKDGLGPLPLVDAQYFVAGLPPIIAGAVAAGIIRALTSIVLPRWQSWVDHRSPIHKVVIYGLLPFLPGVSLVPLLIVVSRNENLTANILFWILLAITFLLAWGTTLLGRHFGIIQALIEFSIERYGRQFSSLDEIIIERFGRRFSGLGETISVYRQWLIPLSLTLIKILDGLTTIIYAYAFPVIIAIVGTILFIKDVYIHIPQEFGGAKVRCAEIDLKREDLSQKTMAALVGYDSAFAEGKVARTAVLKVHFAGTNFLLVSSTIEGRADKGLYEVQRSAVTTIRWSRWCSGE